MSRTLRQVVGQALCGGAVLFWLAADADGQAVRRPAGAAVAPEAGVGVPAGATGARTPVAIRRISGASRRDRVMTPQYNSTVSRGSKPAREWGVITVEYASQPEWIDELTVNFFVLAEATKDGRKQFTLYRKTVTYIDVERDNSHVADVYLLPSALDRFGQVVAMAAEVVVNGDVVAQQGETSLRDVLPADWWKNEKVTKSESVSIRDGYLLNRRESPFALINIDDYEAIK